MKKILMPMMVVMVLTSAMSFTSCSSDVADAIGDAIARELIDEPTIRGTWSNYVEDTTPDRSIRFLQLHRTEDKQYRNFSLVEVQNGKRFVTNGEWTLSKDCKTLMLMAKSGARANQTISCEVIDSKIGSLTIRFEGNLYSFNEVKSKKLDDYLNK